jgi:hypothetical protein
MKNLQSYEEFLFEDSPTFGSDGTQLQVGKSVISKDGFSGIIISKENVNGHIQYRDHQGVIRISESLDLVEYDPINEDLTWWEVTKGILAADAIKAGAALAGGGILIAGYMFANWRKSIANKMESIKRDEKYKELKDKAAGIADKFNSDAELSNMLNQLAKYPYTDTLFVKGKRDKSKADAVNKERNKVMRDIAKYVKGKLSDEEKQYFAEINKILRDKPLVDETGGKLEEDVVSDPSRTVGTGTSTAVSPADQNPGVQGYHNTGDSIGVDTIART